MTMIRTCLLAAVLAAPLAAQAGPPPRGAFVHPHAVQAQPAVVPPAAAVAAPASRHEGLLHLRRNHTVTSFMVSDSRSYRPS